MVNKYIVDTECNYLEITYYDECKLIIKYNEDYEIEFVNPTKEDCQYIIDTMTNIMNSIKEE